MLKHLFILIWNKKKQNSLLLTEVLVSFLVLFAVFTLLVFNYRNYSKPRGFEYSNVWVANFNNDLGTTNGDSAAMFYDNLRRNMLSLPQVKAVCFTNANTPFSGNTSQTGFPYKGKDVRSINYYLAEDSYKDALQLHLLEGRWFAKNEGAAKNKPIVINNKLKTELFGTGKALGQLVGDDKNQMQVIGVVEDGKYTNEYMPAGKAMYVRPDTSEYHWMGTAMIRVAPGSDAAFEGRLYKLMANTMKNANIEITHLEDKRKSANNTTLVPVIILGTVSGFLIINVALGLFGVLWYNINKRRGEIGLRRAVGATGNGISGQLVAESLLLATLALLVGIFFAIQFPLLNVLDLPTGVYLWALLFAIVFIYALVLVCSLYPGKQAAAIYPAVALHED
ncbi:ABC transporter permease [Deminuibacter soli]|uniref:ABC transporter permease n=1 Tax=Deminuibacter soli TaxID=2291815 RepID=A0A3E1NKQ3_9BACT|nr:FtsX-like permease family protein [Deminuibacter soli]RFM28519.1 ABC transporter permease [Deminuibacter soli]